MDLLTQKLLTKASIWIRLLVSWQLSKRAVDFRVKLTCDKIFSLEYWTNSFKMELLSVILSHSGIDFNFLFKFTQRMYWRNWMFWKFWLTCFDYCAAGNLNCRRHRRQKQLFLGKCLNFNHFILSHIKFILESDLKKS